MADTSSLLQRLILSATDLKLLTAQQRPGEPWPDALVEDYLNILRDLVTLADLIDANASDTILAVSKLFQETAALSALFAKNHTRINRLSTRSDQLEQLIYAW